MSRVSFGLRFSTFDVVSSLVFSDYSSKPLAGNTLHSSEWGIFLMPSHCWQNFSILCDYSSHEGFLLFYYSPAIFHTS